MRAMVTCEKCLLRQAVERPVLVPEEFWIVCVRCEKSLRVRIPQEAIDKANEVK